MPDIDTSASAHIIPGNKYGNRPTHLRPLVDSPGKNRAGQLATSTTTMDWDTTVVNHGISWPQVVNDRRHSGWAEVEKKWTMMQQQQQQQQQQGDTGREQHQTQQSAGVPVVQSGESGGALGTDENTKTASSSWLCPHIAIPTPGLEPDFRMRVRLNVASAPIPVGGGGYRKWTTCIHGEWSGEIGSGVVVSGDHFSQDLLLGTTLATQIEASYRLKTAGEGLAYIECKMKGFQTGPPELMRALHDAEKADAVDARFIQHRVTLSMQTMDERYAEKVNFGLWVGSGWWRGLDMIYDVYRIT
ncbi:hypothetical protein F4808DRAFT_417935 [Astrocystis sublimbata]|nr:hypothetical protein F4808DRAFT_417935 [Astrocystis sublimbata]